LIGMLAYALTAPRRLDPIRKALAGAIQTVGDLIERLATGEVSTSGALILRRDLQLSLIALLSQFETQFGGTGSRSRNASASRLWPAIVATQRLGYKVLAACWPGEANKAEKNPNLGAFATPTDAALAKSTLDQLADAYAHGAPPLILPDLRSFVRTELVALNSALESTVKDG